MRHPLVITRRLAGLALLLLALSPVRARAHCDGLDGPVVNAARRALESGKVESVLAWVQKQDEAEIRQAFTRTLAVRRLGTAAKELADLYFFETIVRVHRAGEGAPYTGLKPAGRDLGPAIPAADRALETGDLLPLQGLLDDAVHSGLSEHFALARESRGYATADVEAGRRYVGAYVRYIHYVEALHQSAVRSSHGHFEETAEATGHQH